MQKDLYDRIKKKEEDYKALGLELDLTKKKKIPTQQSILKCDGQLKKFFKSKSNDIIKLDPNFFGNGWNKSDDKMDAWEKKNEKEKVILLIPSTNFLLQTLFDDWYDKWCETGIDETFLFANLNAQKWAKSSSYYKMFLKWDVRFQGMPFVSSNYHDMYSLSLLCFSHFIKIDPSLDLSEINRKRTKKAKEKAWKDMDMPVDEGGK